MANSEEKNTVGVNNGTEGQQQNAEQQVGFIQKTADRIQKAYLKIYTTKAGRMVIKGARWTVRGLAAWKLYDLLNSGKKEGKAEQPTVVVIAPAEEAPALEEPAEESEPEEVEETEAVNE